MPRLAFGRSCFRIGVLQSWFPAAEGNRRRSQHVGGPPVPLKASLAIDACEHKGGGRPGLGLNGRLGLCGARTMLGSATWIHFGHEIELLCSTGPKKGAIGVTDRWESAWSWLRVTLFKLPRHLQLKATPSDTQSNTQLKSSKHSAGSCLPKGVKSPKRVVQGPTPFGETRCGWSMQELPKKARRAGARPNNQSSHQAAVSDNQPSGRAQGP